MFFMTSNIQDYRRSIYCLHQDRRPLEHSAATLPMKDAAAADMYKEAQDSMEDILKVGPV